MVARHLIVVAALAAVMVSGGANAAVTFGSCPFDLVGWSSGGCSSPAGEMINVTVPLTTPARWVIFSTHTHDVNQKGDIYINGNAATGDYVGSFLALSATKTTTQVWDLGQFTNTVTFANITNALVVGARDPYSRIGHSQFFAKDPGVNLAAGATTTGVVNALGVTATAIGTGANPHGMFDGLDCADNGFGVPIWRANPNLDTNFVGVTFDGVVTVDALRVSLTDGLGGHRWLNFDVQVQYTVGGGWDTIGRADTVVGEGKTLWTDVNGVDTRYLWIDLGGMEIAGVRLFGSDATGNNPKANDGLFLVELQVWSGAIPEPVTMSLLALGGLALLRRRK